MIDTSKIQIFAEGLDHPECVATDAEGNIWAGGEAGQIYKISSQGNVQQVANLNGFILGLQVSTDQKWLAVCDHTNKCVWKVDLLSFETTVFAKEAEGYVFQIPNYPCFDRNGNLYVSDSGAFRSVSGRIFKFDANGNGVLWYSKPLNFANGLAISPDNQFLLVACTWLSGVMQIPILPDGSAGRAEVLVKIEKALPDGLAYDHEGNLFISCYTPNRIYRLSNLGQFEILADDWEAHTLSNPTNMTFDRNGNMYVANLGRWHIAKIDASYLINSKS